MIAHKHLKSIEHVGTLALDVDSISVEKKIEL